MISLKGPFSAHLRRAWVGVLGCVAASAVAAPQNSASYSATSDTMDAGGRRSTSANYTNDGSVGGIVGISTVAAPAAMVKHGFIGQLYEATALQLASTPTTVNEAETRLLSGAQVLDDLTTLAIPGTSITWSVQSGPLVSINSSGLATAGPVFQSTAATAQGIYLGQNGTLSLTVLDTIPDNFGTYAGDSLPDNWQVEYFGQNNAQSAPSVDADADGQSNLLEFLAGYIPTDANSRLTTRGTDLTDSTFTLELSRVQLGTRYIFQRTTNFQTWTDILTVNPVASSAPYSQQVPVSGTANFFRVRLEEAP